MDHRLIFIFTVVLSGAGTVLSRADERVQDLLQRLDLKESDEMVEQSGDSDATDGIKYVKRSGRCLVGQYFCR